MSRNKCKYGKNKIVIKYFRTCIVSYDIKEYDVIFFGFFPFVLKQNRVSASESTNKTSNWATVVSLNYSCVFGSYLICCNPVFDSTRQLDPETSPNQSPQNAN